ncbi:MAG TPA: NAD-dependent epimerase/dehydratase family protein [Acidimicrobiales bacterium]|jgi:nucleoside-diphosphate-sugar epimerase|nr:NAD-dependent epimerase/dehydratase family protein [Acidimicrobiales bacterium]
MTPPGAVVCGAGGFIGSHLVSRLKSEGYWVRGVDVKEPAFGPTDADEFLLLDLRDPAAAEQAVTAQVAEVYQLAADMGGMGFIPAAETEVLRNNVLINVHLADAAARAGVGRYFFSSSVCVYRDMDYGEPVLDETDAYPAYPDNEYGWEKLYSERVALAFGRRHGFAVRIARFENCYGPNGTWQGGREKAPAALCRKVAAAADGTAIDVWGDGRAVRSYVYVDDLIDGIRLLMRSDLNEPANLGTSEFVTVDELAALVIDISGKDLKVEHVDGPVGVRSRNFSHSRMHRLGWQPGTPLREGLERTYAWVADQVHRAGSGR